MTKEILLSFATAALFSQAMVACVLFLRAPLTRQRGAWAIPLFFGLVAWFAVSMLLDQIGFYQNRPWAAGLARGSTFLLPPLAWFFILTLSTDAWRLRALHAIHALPALVVGIVIAVLIAFPRPPVGGEAFIVVALRAMWVLFLVVCGFYFAASIQVLHKDNRRIRDFFSFGDNHQRRRQTYILLALILPWAVLVLETAVALLIDLPEPVRIAAGLFRLTCLFMLCVYAVQPRALLLEEDAGLREEKPAPRYARARLEAADMERIRGKLTLAMGRDRLYRDPLLTLRKLSDATGVPQHTISQVLNTAFEQSFFEFVNAARIEEACTLLRTTDLSVLTIAEDIGFNSRSTFNAAFKRQTGKTPTAFRTT